MKSSPFVIRHYKEQHYSTFFNPNTGFFARVEEPGFEEPFWCYHGPELLDISITNWCDKGCSFCYRKSNKLGHHMSLDNYELVMQQARKMHVLQVALGGGNPNQHPDFCDILRITREKYGIIPNYTTNGRGLITEVLEATKSYCGAVAVSAYAPYEETELAIYKLTSHSIKTNIHFIISSESIDTAISWLNEPPTFLENINALIFLNYKPVGRRVNRALLLNNSPRVAEFFQLATERQHQFKVGFDTCTVTGIVRYGDTPPVCYEGCDAGRFSMFVSEDMKMYPCSFMVEAGYEGIPIVGDNMQTHWQAGNDFVKIRNKLGSGSCDSCKSPGLCLGGCPLFPEINLCPKSSSCANSTASAQIIPLDAVSIAGKRH